MKTLRIYISGTVQGVMFRKFIEEQANRIGIRGYARNMEDGRVEVVAEGVDNKVNEMLEVCRAGTQHAVIRDVQVQEIKNQGFEGFRIIRL